MFLWDFEPIPISQDLQLQENFLILSPSSILNALEFHIYVSFLYRDLLIDFTLNAILRSSMRKVFGHCEFYDWYNGIDDEIDKYYMGQLYGGYTINIEKHFQR